MNTSANEFEYSGIENLEAMKYAKNYNRFLVELVRRQLNGKNILDFGAGAGTFATPLRDHDYTVACVEPDPQLSDELNTSGFRTYSAIQDVPPESMDSIYTLNVLEHIEHDSDAIKDLYSRLRSGGRIVIYVPAFAVLFSAMDRLVGHHRRYRRKDLAGKLKAAGFRIETATYIDSLGFAATLAYRLFGDDSGVVNVRAVQIYDRWIFPLSRIIDRIVLGSFGKNLLVVGSRQP